VRHAFQKRKDSLVAEWENAKAIAARLRDQTERRLGEVAEELQREMSDVLHYGYNFVDGAKDNENSRKR